MNPPQLHRRPRMTSCCARPRRQSPHRHPKPYGPRLPRRGSYDVAKVPPSTHPGPPAGAKNVGKKFPKKKKISYFLPDTGPAFSFFWSTKNSTVRVRGNSGRPLRGWARVTPKKFQIFVLGQKRRLRTSATSGFRTRIEKKIFFFQFFFDSKFYPFDFFCRGV